MQCERTPEQLRIRGIRQGINVIGSNAGTGKTDSLSDLIATIYLLEQDRRFPDLPHPVGGDEQRELLRQIMPVTFTRDAAAEFNSRVLALLKSLGIPEPTDKYGRPWRVARTLDSYIQGWFRHPLVFSTWMTGDLDFVQGIARALDLLPETVLTGLASAPSRRRYQFHLKWSWIPGEELNDFLVDCVVREAAEAAAGKRTLSADERAIKGVRTLATYQEEWIEWMKTFVPPEIKPGKRANWGGEFWASRIAAYRSYQREMYDLRSRYRDGALAASPDFVTLIERLQKWEQIQTTKREFLAVYELARANGYHPIRAKSRMMCMPALRELAASDYLFTFPEFHHLARRLYSAKVAFLILDYSDFLNLFVEAADSNRSILEHDREYPKHGIRAKYTFFDEAQDNNQFQNRIVEELWQANDGVPYCTVACGDVKQAIYGFKGASTYGFASLITKVRQLHPENFFTLTCSFRSFPTIVDFGNAIVQTLPHYRATVFPSTTIYTEPGSITVFPPIPDEAGEADCVMREIASLLVKFPNDSIMLLHRNNVRDHPIVEQLKTLNSPQVRLLTIHRSKGLQADHVFVLGLTSGVLPDIRGSYTQEVNLFYVSCTRARKSLYLSAPYNRSKVDKATGIAVDEPVGPSVFFSRLPELAAMADAGGWPSSLITLGATSMDRALDLHYARTEAREAKLRAYWRTSFPEIPMRDRDNDIERDDTGGAPPPPEICALKKRSVWQNGAVMFLSGSWDDLAKSDPGAVDLRPRVLKKLRERYFRNGTVPLLPRPEFMIAIKAGWIYKGPTGRSEFSHAFGVECNKPQPPATTP